MRCAVILLCLIIICVSVCVYIYLLRISLETGGETREQEN